MTDKLVPANAQLQGAAADFLTPADYPAIRAAIRSDVGPAELPDETIAFVTPLASAQVLAIDTGALWPDGSPEAQRDHDAAILLSAAALSATVPFMQSERFREYSYTLAPFDATQRSLMLRQSAITLLAVNLGESVAELMMPTMFTLAQGSRGDIRDVWSLTAPPNLALGTGSSWNWPHG